MYREPFVDVGFPVFAQAVAGLDAPGSIHNGLESRLVFSTAVVGFIEDRKGVKPFHQPVVRTERVRDLPVTRDPTAEAVDMLDCPVGMGLEHDVQILCLTGWPERLRDDTRVRPSQQLAVPMVRVEEGPVVRVVNLLQAIPAEAREPLPVAG